MLSPRQSPVPIIRSTRRSLPPRLNDRPQTPPQRRTQSFKTSFVNDCSDEPIRCFSVPLVVRAKSRARPNVVVTYSCSASPVLLPRSASLYRSSGGSSSEKSDDSTLEDYTSTTETTLITEKESAVSEVPIIKTSIDVPLLVENPTDMKAIRKSNFLRVKPMMFRYDMNSARRELDQEDVGCPSISSLESDDVDFRRICRSFTNIFDTLMDTALLEYSVDKKFMGVKELQNNARRDSNADRKFKAEHAAVIVYWYEFFKTRSSIGLECLSTDHLRPVQQCRCTPILRDYCHCLLIPSRLSTKSTFAPNLLQTRS